MQGEAVTMGSLKLHLHSHMCYCCYGKMFDKGKRYSEILW